MLKLFGRSKLIVAGDANGCDLATICSHFGLSLQHLPIRKIDVRAPDLLATIVFVDQSNAQSTQSQVVKLITQNIFEYGVFLIIASFNTALAITVRSNAITALAKRTDPRELPADLADFIAIGPAENPRVAGISDREQLVTELARALRGLEVELPADPSLTVTGDCEGACWSQDKILIQRAFNGFRQVDLRVERGGRSRDCSVWRVEAHRGADEVQPFIAKAAIRQDLVYEFNTYRDIVRDQLPFPFRAPMLETRFVKGGCRALLVSSFVTRAQRFDSYLGQATHPELPISALFHNALASWRRRAKESRNVSIGAVYVSQQQQHEADLLRSPEKRISGGGPLLPNPKYLQESYNECVKRRWKCVAPDVLWTELRSLPEGDFHTSNVHGDLNVRNVFVRWNATDAILIDFSNAGAPDFLARDPAKLETSIALTCRGRARRSLLSFAVLRRLYCAPLLPMRGHFSTDGRIEAIRQLRREAGGEGITNHEYGIVIACHLLRYARVDPDATVDAKLASRRALSYSVACQLIKSFG